MSEYEYGHPFNYAGKPVAKYVAIFEALAKRLPSGLSVTDLFGGVGTLAKALHPVLAPRDWTAIEIDPDCVAKYRETCPWAWVLQGNAFDMDVFNDIVLIDPHRGTLNAMIKSTEWRGLFENIRASPAKYILMQEYGAYWCHLPNQKELYTELFGKPLTRDTYRDRFVQYMEDVYDFKTLEHRIGLGSCYYLMETK